MARGKHRAGPKPDFETLLDQAEDRASSEEFQYCRYQPFVEARDELDKAGLVQEAMRMQWAAEAFMFGERGQRNKGERYFGPLATYTDDSVFPNWDGMTEDKLDLYEQRANTARNTIVTCRYSDIVWEKRRKHEFARRAISNYVEVARIYHGRGWGLQMVHALQRATELALQLGDNALIRDCVELLTSYLERLQETTDYRWGLEIGRQLTSVSGTHVPGELLDKAEDFSLAAAQHFSTAGPAFRHLQRDFLELVRKIRAKHGNAQGAREAALMIAGSLEEEARQREGHSYSDASAFWEEALQVYRDLGERDKVQELLLKIRDCNLKGQSEFGTISTTVTVPKERVEQLLDYYTSATLEGNLQRLSVGFKPNLSSIRESVSGLEKEAPLLFLIPRRTFSADGRVVGEASGEDDLFRQHVRLGYVVNGKFIAEVIRKLKAEQGLNAAVLVDHLCSSEVISSDRKNFLERGLERYFAADYASCIHILVPQIEHVLRSVLLRIGLPDTYIDDHGIMRVQPLDRVLRTPAIKDAFGEELSTYFYTFLVDQDAENVRNAVAHGMIAWEACNEVTATILVHLLLALTTFRFHEVEPQKSADDNKPI